MDVGLLHVYEDAENELVVAVLVEGPRVVRQQLLQEVPAERRTETVHVQGLVLVREGEVARLERGRDDLGDQSRLRQRDYRAVHARPVTVHESDVVMGRGQQAIEDLGLVY